MARNDGGYRATSIASFAESTLASGGNSGEEESSPVSEMSLPVASLKVEETIYRGEGNANIVIALPQVSQRTHWEKEQKIVNLNTVAVVFPTSAALFCCSNKKQYQQHTMCILSY